MSFFENNYFKVVGIDEIQFFEDTSKVLSVIEELIRKNVIVIVAGLDLDFKNEPFGCIPNLLAVADEIVKVKAVCTKCGADANRTQRLIEGRPASISDKIIKVGSTEAYEARCKACHVLVL